MRHERFVADHGVCGSQRWLAFGFLIRIKFSVNNSMALTGAILAWLPPQTHARSRGDLTFNEGVAKTNAGLPNLHPNVLEFRNDIGAKWWGRTMSAQIPRPISIIAFASALLGFVIGVPIHTAFAVDCLGAPDSSTPPNSHWYYRTDRTQQRQCWHLRADGQSPEQGAGQVVREAPPAKSSQTMSAAGPYSLARFKDFLVQQGRAKLSEQEIE